MQCAAFFIGKNTVGIMLNELCVYAMNTLDKLELLNANCSVRDELDRILSQLLSVMLTCHRQKLAVYDRDVSRFEQNYSLDSNQFQEQFDSGALGDKMGLFEWFSLCELRKDVLVEISKHCDDCRRL